MSEHRKLTEHDEETGEPYDVCPSCSDDWPCVYAERDALRKKVEGQGLLLIGYRIGKRPPERAFKLIEQADAVLAARLAPTDDGGGEDE